MALVQIDEVAVNRDDWSAMQAGDVAAKARIQSRIDQVFLYMHVLPVGPDEIVVTLRDLEKHNVIEGVMIDVGCYRIEPHR